MDGIARGGGASPCAQREEGALEEPEAGTPTQSASLSNLIGTWSGEVHGGGSVTNRTLTFHPDGTFTTNTSRRGTWTQNGDTVVFIHSEGTRFEGRVSGSRFTGTWGHTGTFTLRRQ